MSEAIAGAAPVAAPPTQSAQSNAQTSKASDTGSSSGSQASDKSAQNVPTTPEMFDVKVNGKNIRMTKQEMHDRASMSFAAQQKFDEAAKMRKDFEEKESNYKKDPIKAFLDYANSLPPEQRRKAIEDYYYKEFLEADTMTEEQKRLREYEAKVKKYEEDDRNKKLKDEQEEETRLTNQQREFLQGQIIEAMDASGLPKTKFFVSRMAFYMRQNAVNGWNAPKEMIVRQVLNERKEIMSDMTEGSSYAQLKTTLGENFINKVVRGHLEELRSSRGKLQAPATSSRGNGTGVVDNNGQRLSSSEVQQRLNDIKRGKI